MPSATDLVARASSTHAAARAAAFSFVLLATVLPYARAADPAPAAPVAASATTPPALPTKSYVTIGDKPSVLFDAPSERANKNFIIQRGTPLEILVKLGKWTKVRDVDGSFGWIENSTIGGTRNASVSAGFAEVRAAANATAPLVFEAQRGVLLEITGNPVDGWIPVRHRDGQAGFVKQSQVWGD